MRSSFISIWLATSIMFRCSGNTNFPESHFAVNCFRISFDSMVLSDFIKSVNSLMKTSGFLENERGCPTAIAAKHSRSRVTRNCFLAIRLFKFKLGLKPIVCHVLFNKYQIMRFSCMHQLVEIRIYKTT